MDSTAQGVALLDARKALDLFAKKKIPVIGLIEGASTICCPPAGREARFFSSGGVRAATARLGLPFLGDRPLALDVCLAGDVAGQIANTHPRHMLSRA